MGLLGAGCSVLRMLTPHRSSRLDRVLSLLQQADPLACPKCGDTENLISVKTTTTAPDENPMMCSACGENFDGVAA